MTGSGEAGVVPFRALRYWIDEVGDLGAVWAPPYDVIGPEEAAALRQRSPYNIVRITNPEGEAPSRYADAARTLDSWVSDQILAREESPAFYVHRHRFEFAGAGYERTGVWALLRLEPFDAGVVLPHERTMKGPKADRLALMRACRAQLSPIFFICSDPGGRLSDALGESAGDAPLEETEFPAGESHRIWRLAAPAAERLSSAMAEQVFLIADGHHRYETALAYRDGLIEEGAPRTGRQAHEYVLAYIVPENDPGLLLLPTHRVVGGDPLEWDAAVEEFSDRFEVMDVEDRDLEPALTALDDEAGRPAFILVTHERSGGRLMRLREPDAFTGISSVAFHDVFLAEGLGLSRDEQIARMSYLKDPVETLERVRTGSAQAVALLAAPEVAQVRAAAAAGKRMPPKTTFFWPKVPTGVAVHAVDPDEVVG